MRDRELLLESCCHPQVLMSSSSHAPALEIVSQCLWDPSNSLFNHSCSLIPMALIRSTSSSCSPTLLRYNAFAHFPRVTWRIVILVYSHMDACMDAPMVAIPCWHMIIYPSTRTVTNTITRRHKHKHRHRHKNTNGLHRPSIISLESRRAPCK